MDSEELRESILAELDTFQIPLADTIFVSEKAASICKDMFQGDVDRFMSDLLAFRMNCKIDAEKEMTEDFLDNFEQRTKTNNEGGGTRRKGQFGSTPSRTPTGRSFTKIRKAYQAPAAIFLDYGISDYDSERILNDQMDTGNFDETDTMDDGESYRAKTPPLLFVSFETFSPAGATPSHKFTERENIGKIEINFGDVHSTNWISDIKRGEDIGALARHYDSAPILDKPYQFMNQSIRSIQEALNDRTEFLTERMQKAYPELSDPDAEGKGLVYLTGLLFNGDESERATRLVPDKIFLRNSKFTGDGICIDVSSLSDCSLFPGEVVSFGGKMSGPSKFVAEKLFNGAIPASVAFDSDQASNLPDRLAVVLASGPFTPSDGLGYEPLVALLNYVQKHRPHVLILIGPFISANREDILTLPMTCQEFFDHILFRIVDACSCTGTQLVVVASSDDANMAPCYPAPPNRPPRTFEKMQPLFVSDPCLLRIGGLLFGITATDVLFHLSSEEMKSATTDGGGDRMNRLARHLLLQQTFYPLYPSPVDISVDVENVNAYARLPVSPHVLVLPSVLRYFLKDLGNVLAVNPGSLAKGRGGGTFCRIEFDQRKLAHENGDILRCLCAQVLRI